MPLSYLLEGLNPPQQEAVQHKDGPLLVLAGPGSGKTRVVTHRIAWLLQNGVRGHQVLALTFTNKAADEMKQRIEALAPRSSVWIGTFHKFCSWVLRQYATHIGLGSHFSIYDTNESKKLLDNVLGQTRLPPGVNSGQIASAISWAKNALTLPAQYVARQGHLLGSIVEDVYPAYQEALKRSNAVDFDDLLLHIAVMLKNHAEIRETLDNRFRYILVDEYQDTNLAQYAIVRMLSVKYRNLAVTGDPDQSIYGWRGANIRNILDFEKDFEDVKIIRLEQNYRSTKRILRAASEVIKYNVQRKKKELYTDNPDGVPVRVLRCYNQQEEAESIAEEIAAEVSRGKRRPKDYAIFYRMNALSRNLEHALRRMSVPFQLVRGLEFFNRKEIKDIVAYLQLFYNKSDTISFLRIINEPRRGIGNTTIARIENHAYQHGVSHLEAARDAHRISQLSAKVRKSVIDFVKMFDQFERIDNGKIETLIMAILDATQYDVQYANSDDEEDQQRLANIEELISEAKEFDSQYAGDAPLETFLEQVALASDIDAWDDDSDRVSLMTLHAAKGLEFPVVYLIATEEGMIPHERSANDPMQLEEERRLFFVGMTRAEQELRLSRTQYREFRGSYNVSILSRFLFELPQDEILRCESPSEIPDDNAMREIIEYGLPGHATPDYHVDPNYCDVDDFDGHKQSKKNVDEFADDYVDEYIDEQYEELPTIDVNDRDANTEVKTSAGTNANSFGDAKKKILPNPISQKQVTQKTHTDLKLHLTTAAELNATSMSLSKNREQRKKSTPNQSALNQATPSDLSAQSASQNLSALPDSQALQKSSTSLTPPINLSSESPKKKGKRPQFQSGMIVQHKDYGSGTVLSVTTGNEKTVTVDFEETVGRLQLPLPCKSLRPFGEEGLGDIFIDHQKKKQ